MAEASKARRWLSVGVGLAVSGAALAGLMLVEGRAAQADALAVVRAVGAERTSESAPAALAELAQPDWSGVVRGSIRGKTGARATMTAVPAEAIELAVAKSKPVHAGKPLQSVQAIAGDAPAVAAVVVPDFVGKRLGAVRREARKLGIKLVARICTRCARRTSRRAARCSRARRSSCARACRPAMRWATER